MSEDYFRSHFWRFQINTELLFFCKMFDKMAASGHFGFPKFTFDRISGHFRSIGHFGFPKFTFDRISGHFKSIQIFFVFSAAILDIRKSLLITFLAISGIKTPIIIAHTCMYDIFKRREIEISPSWSWCQHCSESIV